MAIETICSADAVNIVQGVVYPLTAISVTVTGIIIGISYMVAQAISNPRISVWAKTELFQLFISIFVVGIILQSISLFCSIDVGSFYSIFGVSSTMPPGSNMFDAANSYLKDTGVWLRDLIHVTRYHIGAFNLLQSFGRNECETDSSTAWLFCLFGPVMAKAGGGSGAISITSAPDSGYGMLSSALGAAYNTIMFSYFSVLNYIFILRYVFSGFVLFFLPLGVLLRALPYLRTLGSLLMSVAISFLIVYPLVLATFYIDFQSSRILAPIDSPAFEYKNEDIAHGKVNMADIFDSTLVDDVFENKEDQTIEIIKLAGNAFLAGVFIPSLALLAAAAAVGYINRFLGEEIDLSRIVQLM